MLLGSKIQPNYELYVKKEEKKLIFSIVYRSFTIRILKGENLCYILQPKRWVIYTPTQSY